MLAEKKVKTPVKVMEVALWSANVTEDGNLRELFHGALVVDSLDYLEYIHECLIISIGYTKLLETDSMNILFKKRDVFAIKFLRIPLYIETTCRCIAPFSCLLKTFKSLLREYCYN